MTFLDYFNLRDEMDRQAIHCYTRPDREGILRWKANGYVIPPELMRRAAPLCGLTEAQVQANKIAWEAQQKVIWAPIHAYVDELRRRRGELPAQAAAQAAPA